MARKQLSQNTLHTTSFEGSLFSTTKEAEKRDPGNEIALYTASTVDNKLSLTGVTDRTFVNRKLLFSPGSPDVTALSHSSNHSHAFFVLTNFENRHSIGACNYCGEVQEENMEEVEYLSNILLCE